MRRCSASELPSARGTPSPTLRHTPRQRRAHRTGHKPVPLSRVRSMLRIAGCRQPAIRSGATRPCGCSLHVQPASGHHDAAHMRQSQPRPCLGARTRATRMPQGGKELPWWKEANLDACASSANAENKTPPGMATRGRSRSSGDRGGRSPRESAGCQKSRCRARSVPRRSLPFARSARPQREGCRAGLLSKE